MHTGTCTSLSMHTVYTTQCLKAGQPMEGHDKRKYNRKFTHEYYLI